MAPKRGREALRPELPASLLDKIGGAPGGASQSGRPRHQFQSRKDRRKEERVQKRQQNVPHRTIIRKPRVESSKPSPVKVTAPTAKAPKSKATRTPQPVSDDDDDDFGGFEDEDEDEDEDEEPRKPVVSKAAKDKLAREDAEIAELERKLGIKSKKALPKAFHEDGLDDILGELADDGDEEDEGLAEKRKRKAEADEWLAMKRRKAMPRPEEDSSEESDDGLDGLDDESEGSGDSLDEDGEDDFEGDDDDDDDDDLEGFEGSDAEEEEKPVRVRENPYVAPVTAMAPVQKYVPPARRQEAGSDAELLSRIRRQTQGLINRLTESNLVAILGDVERLYRDYPRQHVTSIVVDLLLVQICEPTSLPDTLLILNAGFSTALYKVVGPDFGAQLIQQAVERFKDYHAQIPEDATQNLTKHTSNLITFLAEVYNFQLIGCNLIFDYIRFLLNDLSELNAELLLRIVRMAGQNLRQDDPLALKDIVALIRPAVKKVGEANLSVRTKFMIESINDLKNNKVKTGASASAVVHDHTTRMKKLLGSLNSRKLKATEPLRIGLKDIEESDKRGKWWLVGASWAGRDEKSETQRKAKAATDDDGDSDAESILLSSDDEAMPDLAALAREQNMNTDVRRSIFIAVMSANDYEDAYARVTKLRLNKHRQKEIAYVVMQCACVEQQYNPYYALVAKRLCSDGRIRFAFQDSLWKFFRRLGESTFGEDADEEDEEDESIDIRRVFNLSKMFGFLVANGAIGLSVLKCLSLVDLQPKTRDFVEVMLITLFQEVKVAKNDVGRIFQAVADMPGLSKGLQYFLRKVRKSDLLVKNKEKKVVRRGCEEAVQALITPPVDVVGESQD
ncbi:Suppressor of glycerol defect protein 1 [Cytospora mali]|uniref:Suppressor of glycerol defect protein 1 n=1 Tax=Cytospora mali TaxID=578113 RepID=A0A194VEN8_CYTMA|nr:Suppressor of glycerol defect protein 1 [Valsa mali var. pyri (nom. inval.)]